MIERARVQNFRCYADFSVELAPGINVITGRNGSGKTTLMEAFALAATGKSWRSNFAEILRKSPEFSPADHEKSLWWRVDVKFSDEDAPRTVEFLAAQNGNPARKIFKLGGETFARLPKKFRKPLLLFEPGDLQLFYGSPARRRDFFDRFIAEIDPNFATTRNKFDRVLRQRNNLLKSGLATRENLFIWNVQFAELSSEISRRRTEVVARINAEISARYYEISGRDERVKINFLQKAPRDADQLLARISADEFVTSVGAQKDEFHFLLDGKAAKTGASRGENRTILFAIFAAQIEILREKYPEIVVLFDDIDGELDPEHRRNLYATPTFRDNNLIATTISFAGGNQNEIKL